MGLNNVLQFLSVLTWVAIDPVESAPERPKLNHMMKSLLLLGALVFAGCATAPKPRDLQNVSSGYIGCRPDDVEVSAWEPGYGYSNWNASCRGKQYRCTASLGGSSCKELAR
jgi:hypothetical protein